jgi:glucokinase
MIEVLAGVDIGGTKCDISLGRMKNNGNSVEILKKISFPTPSGPNTTIKQLIEALEHMLMGIGEDHALASIGISCGGPLDSSRGLIMSPPNLPGWDHIDIISPFRDHFDVKVGLQNDANACALAEWKWGAGQGTRNMVFLTFGTGMGAGFILNGQLYSGTNDLAGEVGHIRMEKRGPIGFGKAGSFEGFCSGGGIAQLARTMVEQHLHAGGSTLLCSSLEQISSITAKQVGEAAGQGDDLAIRIYQTVAYQLGRGLAMLVDLLNPEMIVIGSIYARQEKLLRPIVMEVLQQEALPGALSCCSIVPAALGEFVGDYAGMSVAWYKLNQ